MQSLNIIFPAAGKVELVKEEVGPVGPDELLCKAKKSLISTGTELLCLRGVFDRDTLWDGWVKYPFHPGYSMAAEVIETGENVKDWKPGDRIYTQWTHNQYFKTKAKNVYRTPDEIDDETASWFSLATITQVGMRRAELKLGESVGVVGLGLLGQLVVQYLRVNRARRIVAIDPAQPRLETALRHGATHTLAMDAEAARDEVWRITGGAMLDVVFDVTGHPAVLAKATRLAGRMGRVILLGDTTTPSQQTLGPRVVADSLSILGVHSNMANGGFPGWDRQSMSELFFDYLRQGRMEVASLTTSRHSPAEAEAVYERLQTDRSAALGVVFDWDRL